MSILDELRSKPMEEKPTEEKAEKAEKPIDQLRGILARAATRDQELEKNLTALAADLLKDFGFEDKAPVWAELKPADGERALDEHFVMQQDNWLHGDLVLEVAPGKTFVVSLMIREAPHHTHEVAVRNQVSQTIVIDPPEEKDRAEHRKKLFERIFGSLEGQVRRSVSLPVG
jgi:hypothetical protein